jgi:RHS repeat-associated protein
VREDGSLGEEILFTWDAANLAEQQSVRDGVTETDTWDWEPGTHRAAAQVRSRFRTPDEIDRQFFAIVTDLVGTPSELIGEDGEIAWRAATSLWGRPLSGADADLCPLAFPGQYRDAETGLHYNLSRYYDPDTASYLSPDPLGLARRRIITGTSTTRSAGATRSVWRGTPRNRPGSTTTRSTASTVRGPVRPPRAR